MIVELKSHKTAHHTGSNAVSSRPTCAFQNWGFLMTSISEFMTQDHRHCDDIYTAAEEKVAAGQWDEATQSWSRYRDALERHLTREENILFPAFESQTGMTQGPTAVMRMEHEQMRAIVAQMDDAIQAEDSNTFLGLAETLMILTQQHNMKEEQVLYPMSDQALGDPETLIRKMQEG
jgi:hemerythrin-like domain-containing protein